MSKNKRNILNYLLVYMYQSVVFHDFGVTVGNWAFSWVQVIGHNKKVLLLLWSILSICAFAGLARIDFSTLTDNLLLIVLGLVLMGSVVGYLLESPKIALLQLVLSFYVLAMTLGIYGWLGAVMGSESLLGLMVLLTIVSSNLVHLLSTLAREMARGLFQYDAIAEALKLNTSPIFLSNLTTALGFWIASWVEPQLSGLAWLVVIGVLISFLMTLSWLPLTLLSWLLEFRVGNTADRHGLTFIANHLKDKPLFRKALIYSGVASIAILLVINRDSISQYQSLFGLVALFGVLFWLAWKSVKLAFINLTVNFFALLISISLFMHFFSDSQWVWLLWMVPLGIIVDDGIHFFARYARAQNSVFSDPESAVIYAMASVGRPIWITSWVLLTGLLILLFSENQMVFEAAGFTILALAVTTFLVLLLVPAILMSQSKS